MANSGTPRKFTLDGAPFPMAADTNLNLMFSPYTKEGQPTTGETVVKYTLRNPDIEGVTFQIGPRDAARLLALSKRLDNFPISVTLIDGTTYKTRGQVDYEGYETETGKATCKVIPSKAINAWTELLV